MHKMSRNKQEYYKALPHFENVYSSNDFKKGTWSKQCFGNDHPITLELGCGKGDYVLALAQKYPERNFIGIDIKGDRLYSGAKKAIKRNLPNVIFMREYIQFLTDVFAENEISEIWITFPDPYPRNTKKRKRLSSPFFLDIYRRIIKQGAILHFKTDADALFEFTLETLHNEHAEILYLTYNLHAEGLDDENLSILTTYEKRHIARGKSIKYVQFRIN